MNEEPGAPDGVRWAMVLFFVFVGLVVAKLALFTGALSAFLFIDEGMYVGAARQMIREGMYPVTGPYPPLYSAALVPAMASSGGWYDWAIRLNVLMSSAIIVPLWLIARTVVSRPLALLSVVLGATLPYQAVYPRMMLSENLYMPLFALAVYLAVAEPSSPVQRALLLGVVLGFGQLTRHIHLIILPILAAGYLVYHVRGQGARRLGMAAGAMAAGFALVYGPWLAYAMTHGAAVMDMIGLPTLRAVEARPHAAGALASSFLPWTAVYVLTLAALLAPYAPATLVGRWRGDHDRPLRRLGILTALTLTASLVTAIIFCWRYFAGSANSYVEERYLLPPVALLPIIAVAALVQRQGVRIGWPRIAAVAISAGLLVAVIHVTLLEDRWWPQRPFVGNTSSAPMLGGFIPNGAPGAALAFGLLTATAVLTVVMSRAPRAALAVLAAGVLSTSLVGGYRLTMAMDRAQQLGYHGRALAPFVRDASLQPQTVPIWVDPEVGYYPTPVGLTQLLEFWDASPRRFMVRADARPPADATHGLFVSHERYASPLREYRAFGRRYGIYAVPVVPMELRILAFGPTEAVAGRPFNRQPDGSAAAWVHAEGLSKRTVAELDGVRMLGGVNVDTGILTYTVPPAAYAKPGEYDLRLRDDSTGRVSAPVRFVVRSP